MSLDYSQDALTEEKRSKYTWCFFKAAKGKKNKASKLVLSSLPSLVSNIGFAAEDIGLGHTILNFEFKAKNSLKMKNIKKPELPTTFP